MEARVRDEANRLESEAEAERSAARAAAARTLASYRERLAVIAAERDEASPCHCWPGQRRSALRQAFPSRGIAPHV